MGFSFTHGYTDEQGLTYSQRRKQEQAAQNRRNAAQRAKTRRAIERYTMMGCLRAEFIHRYYGEGARTISQSYSIPNAETTRAADAAIDAGRYIRAHRHWFEPEFNALNYDEMTLAAHWLNSSNT